MKPDPSNFDSFTNKELTSAQKAALESILYSGEYNFEPKKPPEEPKQPVPQAVIPQQQRANPQQQYTNPQNFHIPQNINIPQEPAGPDENRVVTIDLTKRTTQADNRQVVRHRTRESRQDTQIPSYDSYRPPKKRNAGTRQNNIKNTGYTRKDTPRLQTRRPGARNTGGKRNNIMTMVLLGVMGLVAIGIMVRCLAGTPAPTADMTNKTIIIGESVVPMDFITDIHSESEIVSVEFVSEPNVNARTNQVVEIIITDENGKSTTVTATLIIRINQEPPTIEGTATIMSTLGNPIIYRQDVHARDDFGRPLELHVDSSEVNQHEVGVYKIKFSATDLTGNTTEIIEEVHILRVDINYVFNQVDAILSDIVHNDMSQLEKVRAIHAWIRTNISYASVIGGPETVYEDAFRALSDRRGNCYVFYAIGEVMLTRAGIENMPIDRIPGTPTRHRWSLINPDYLGWHHFDTTPTRLGLGAETAFFTDSQAREFTNRFVEFNNTQNFYTFNPELYPDIVQ